MKKENFSEEIVELISSAENRSYYQDGYVGEKTYGLCIYEKTEKNKTSAFVTVTDADNMLCIKNIREDFDNMSAQKVLEDLCRRMERLFPAENGRVDVAAVLSDDESVELADQPVMIKLSGKALFPDEKKKKAVCSELNDWLDAVSVMLTTAESEKKKSENYKRDYTKIMTGGGLGREEEKDYSSTMSMISFILTILGVLTYKSMFFPIMGLMASGFSAYRCYVNKNIKGAVVCLVCFVASLIFSYLGWINIKTDLQAQIKK